MDYANWATHARRESSQRRRLALHISGNGSSSWPTPTEDDRSNVAADVNRDYQSFAAASAMWPTPTQGDTNSSGSAGYEKSETHSPGTTLTDAMRMWPTPDGGIRTGFNRSPSEGAALRPVLAEAAEMWATPKSRDWKGGQGNATRHSPDLDKQAEYEFPSSLPDATSTTPGEPSSPSTPGSPRRLNPAFVEWLMGWPGPGWTDLDSPFSATALCQWSRHMRGLLCELGWRVRCD